MDKLFYAASSASPLYGSAGAEVLLRGEQQTSDLENDMLSDCVVHNNLRKSHDRKTALRRGQKLGPLGKKPVLQVSQSLSSLRSNNNNLDNILERDETENAALQATSVAVDPLQVQQMMGRVAYSDERVIEDLAIHGRDTQFTSMKESVAMNQVMQEVLQLHGMVNGIIQELQRKDLAARVELANDQYVGLFERMLAEVLHMQRSKFQQNAKTLQALKAELAAVRSKEAAGRDRVFEANSIAANAEMTVAGLVSELGAANKEVERLNHLVSALENDKLSMQVTMEINGRGIPERQVQKMIRDARQEEIMKATKQQNDSRRKWIKETEMRLREAEGKTNSLSMAELTEQAKQTNDFKRPKVDGGSQTEVDEQGLWDKQDGWSLPVTGTLVARQRWRAAIRFSKCPKCKGTGDFIGLCARLLKALLRGVPLSDDDVPKGKTGSTWIIPDDLVRFMGNLPRSVFAMRPRPMPWVLRRVYKLCDDKKAADDTDERLGYSLQSTPEFLIEHYLKMLPSRSDAELALYEIFLSLQEHYKMHPLLHTFARLVGVLDGHSAEEMARLLRELAEEKERKKDRAAMEKMRGLGARAKTALLEKNKEDEAFKRERAAGKAAAEETLKLCDAALSSAIFGIYHYARSCLLEEYQGAYASKIRQTKAAAEILGKYEDKFRSEADFSDILLPSHVCLDKGLHFFIPFDRALRVLGVLLSFLEEKQYQAALRSCEALVVFLNPDGSLYLLEGMHSMVRATMREFLNSESPDGSDLTFMQIHEQQKAEGKAPPRDEEAQGPVTEEELERDRSILMVNLDSCLRIVLECMLLRTSFVENRLAEIFIEGDENGDGVLSFKEFTTIVAVVAPHFNERRIIRMFREALMLGNDDDSIGPKAFVDTCKKHGLVQLINVSDLRVGLLKSLSLSDTEKAERAAREAAAEAERIKQLETSTFKSSFQSPVERKRSILQASLSRKMGSLNLQGGNADGSGGGKRKQSLAQVVRASTQSSFFKNALLNATKEAVSLSPADSPSVSRLSLAAQSDGGDLYVPRAGSAASPHELALVEMYAAQSAVAAPEDSSLESPVMMAAPPVLALPFSPSLDAASGSDFRTVRLTSALGSVAQTMATSSISEAHDENDDSEEDEEQGAGASGAINRPLVKVLEEDVTAPMASPVRSPSAPLRNEPSSAAPALAPAPAPALAPHVVSVASSISSAPTTSSIGVMPLSSKARKDKPDEEISKSAGATVKEQLRLRREGRLQQRLADSARLAGGCETSMNDSDDDAA